MRIANEPAEAGDWITSAQWLLLLRGHYKWTTSHAKLLIQKMQSVRMTLTS